MEEKKSVFRRPRCGARPGTLVGCGEERGFSKGMENGSGRTQRQQNKERCGGVRMGEGCLRGNVPIDTSSANKVNYRRRSG